MFNDKHFLTDSVLAGIKTVTRRKIPYKTLIKWGVNKFTFPDLAKDLIQDSPYKIGDKLAILQPYRLCTGFIKELEEFKGLSWEETEARLKALPGWWNKMFAKADWMPYHIEITGIRAEYLHAITGEDCMKEGIRSDQILGHPFQKFFFGNNFRYYDTPRIAFARLYDCVSGKGEWEKNPFVYVYEFKLVKNV